MNKWMVEEIESDVGARWVITMVEYLLLAGDSSPILGRLK